MVITCVLPQRVLENESIVHAEEATNCADQLINSNSQYIMYVMMKVLLQLCNC